MGHYHRLENFFTAMNKLKLNAQNMYMHYIEKLQLCHNIMFVMHAILQHVFLCEVY